MNLRSKTTSSKNEPCCATSPGGFSFRPPQAVSSVSVVAFRGWANAGSRHGARQCGCVAGASRSTRSLPAVRALRQCPEVMLVNASGRDHPRGAGLALHLGAVLDIPTIGITHRPFGGQGEWPADERGAASPVSLEGHIVALAAVACPRPPRGCARRVAYVAPGRARGRSEMHLPRTHSRTAAPRPTPRAAGAHRHRERLRQAETPRGLDVIARSRRGAGAANYL